MKVYTIDGMAERVNGEWEPMLVEAEVVKETRSFLHFAQRESGFHYSKMINRTEASLTPREAWLQYLAEQTRNFEAGRALMNRSRGLIDLANTALEALP